MIDKLTAIVGAAHVLTGPDTTAYATDISGMREAQPLAVVRPATTQQVADIVKLANATPFPVIPVGGRTGLCGGGIGEAVILSFDRMSAIREIRADAQVAVVEAGAILSDIHEAAEAQNLVFPLTFGAKGSARVGGFLGTNAGGSNVVRYGNTRDLVLGIEAVLPTGEIVDLMSGLHKNNSGYDLRHLLIGSEGTLGIITAATLKLHPKPGAYATAMVGMKHLSDALPLLNEVQRETGGQVEAFEYMPQSYIQDHLALNAANKPPFDAAHDVNILIEIGALAPRDCSPDDTGEIPIVGHLEEILARYLEEGLIDDAIVARTEAQRQEMWARREAAAEIAYGRGVRVTNDVAVPLDQVETFLTRADAALQDTDPGATTSVVSHLGDGNVHYTVFPTRASDELKDQIMERVEDIVLDLGGSFSAEHGIGTAKLSSMARRKDKAALAAMRAIKAALDPKGIMNPGKLLPPEGANG